jgi:shikimate dehydrogenase
MHNAGFAALGLNFCYVACDVDPKNLRAAIDGAKSMNFAGLNLTVPHKLLALNMVDELDESARVWGAVNTIRFEGHAGNDGWRPMGDFGTDSPGEVRSVGFNTDADGLVAALREDLKIELGGKNVLLLGAGGAGRTAALRVAAEKAATLFWSTGRLPRFWKFRWKYKRNIRRFVSSWDIRILLRAKLIWLSMPRR